MRRALLWVAWVAFHVNATDGTVDAVLDLVKELASGVRSVKHGS